MSSRPLARPGLVSLALLTGVSLVGCGERPSKVAPTGGQQHAVDPWPVVAAQLRRDADAPTVRRALDGLNNALARADSPDHRPAGLAAGQDAEVRTLLNLTEPEVQELRPTTFTALDTHHVLDALYLRDAARSLEPAGLPPAKQAELAFHWVCRQVVLRPWVAQVSTGATPQYQVLTVPPSYVLRRGSGSGLERAYVFLALLQQFGLDGCLIGPPGAESQPPSPAFTNDPNNPPRGPFWAVGVRVRADVLVFDPFRGEPVPGPGGQGVATLAQLAADPDLVKPWRDDKARPWDVPADAVKASAPVLTVALSSAAPRMARLEKELAGESGVRLYADPKALQARFAAETKLPAVKFWAAPNDPFAYTRVLRSFLPPSEGGVAEPPVLLSQFQQGLTPPSVLNLPPEMDLRRPDNQLLRDPIAEVMATALFVYRAAFQPTQGIDEQAARTAGNDPNSIAAFLARESAPEKAQQRRPFEYLYQGQGNRAAESRASVREQIQRGQFFEVAPDLVRKREEFTKAAERVRSDRSREQLVRDWLAKAREAFPPLLRLQSRSDANPAEVAEAERKVAEFRRTQETARQAMVELAVADAGVAEATYLLAVCRHEQAEREQARYDRLTADPKKASPDSVARAKDKAQAAWGEAAGWWQRYEPYAAAQDASFRGRADHARRLADRAARLADPAKAR